MPPSCTVCRHPKLDEIETEIAKQTPLRNIAAQYGTSPNSLLRHRNKCMQEKMALAKVNAEK